VALDRRGDELLQIDELNLIFVAADTTEIVQADVLDAPSLRAALAGVETAYYLVHSMGTGDDFEEHDRQAAENFATAARENGVKRIIYLGGLGDETRDLSAHLRSRHEVGRILLASGAQVIEFRASIIIGSGSLSFELIRALVERLPAMVTPRWVEVPAQPIGIEDVLSYLRAALDLESSGSRIYEIGGPDRVSYGELMREYARQRGLRRFTIPVPLLTPRLSSLWLRLVTPLHAEVGRKLIDSIRHPTVVNDDSALRDFPIRPLGVRDAIARALANEDRALAETRWSDALSAAASPPAWGGRRFGNRLIDSRSVRVAATRPSSEPPFGGSSSTLTTHSPASRARASAARCSPRRTPSCCATAESKSSISAWRQPRGKRT